MKKTHVFYYVFISIACLFFCSFTLAQTSMVAGSTQAISKTLIVLLGVIGLIVGLAWLSKFFGVNNLVGHKDIKTIAQIPLGQREKAVLIDVYGKKILLGVSPGGVNTLHIFDDSLPESISTHQSNVSQSNDEESSENELAGNEAGYNSLLPREYDDLTLSKKTSKEMLDFSSFIKKIISSGNVNR